MIEKCRHWKEAHPDLWEFILFNLLSNCATVTNFLVLWLTTGVLFAGLTQPFRWLFFDYTAEGSGGLGGFLGFLTAYTCAQIVNYIVQRKLVFGATVEISKTIGWYILTVVVAGVISVALPGYITPVLSTYIGGMAATAANIINIILQVLINYPMMKFVIMKKEH